MRWIVNTNEEETTAVRLGLWAKSERCTMVVHSAIIRVSKKEEEQLGINNQSADTTQCNYQTDGGGVTVKN